MLASKILERAVEFHYEVLETPGIVQEAPPQCQTQDIITHVHFKQTRQTAPEEGKLSSPVKMLCCQNFQTAEDHADGHMAGVQVHISNLF